MVEISTTPVGRSYGRREGRAKVTGRADYIYNLRLPSMLHAKVYRSPVAHGRILIMIGPLLNSVKMALRQ